MANEDLIPHQLDDDARQRLIEHLDRYRSQKTHSDAKPNKVTGELCDLVNEMYEEGIKPSEIVEAMPFSSNNTIYYHVRGDCSHTQRRLVTYDECMWMRIKAQKGAPRKTLAMLYDLSIRNATDHILGECGHDNGIEPLTNEELKENTAEYVFKTEAVCDMCGKKFRHKRHRDRRFCSKACACSHAGKVSTGVVSD